jgi:glycerol kinase
MHRGVFPEPDAFAALWSLERRFMPVMKADERERSYAGWKDAVSRTLSNRD